MKLKVFFGVTSSKNSKQRAYVNFSSLTCKREHAQLSRETEYWNDLEPGILVALLVLEVVPGVDLLNFWTPGVTAGTLRMWNVSLIVEYNWHSFLSRSFWVVLDLSNCTWNEDTILSEHRIFLPWNILETK